MSLPDFDCSAVYDPGSNISIMSSKIAKKLNLVCYTLTDGKFKMISGYGRVLGLTKVEIKIFNVKKEVIVFIMDESTCNHDFLVGLDLIETFYLCQNERLKVYQKWRPWYKVRPQWTKSMLINTLELKADLSHLSTQKGKELRQLVQQFNSAFAKDKFDIGQVRDHEAAVKLTEHKYVYRKPYKCNIIDQKEIESQVNKLLEAKLIQHSTSPFAAPVTLAAKKQADGSVRKNRLCIDYTALNKIVVPESQPFPLIEDLIVKARDCQWFSVLDINSAFWSIPVRVKDRYKTAFVTQTGHYDWRCLPFGLKTSPAIFQRVLRNCLKKNGLDEFCCNYIDDILIFSKTFSEHLVHLKKILIAVQREGFKLSFEKCNFAKNKVKYLGHIIQNNLTMPVTDNVMPLLHFPVPKTQKNVRQFLGKVNFYHSYIPNSAILLAPLHNLLKKNVPFIWSNECQKSFDLAIKCLTSEPCLAIFGPERETILQTDASQEGIGAVLKQRQSDGTFHPVAFFSKKLTEPQKRKKATFLEALAIKEALAHWSHRLRGIKFKVLSDHKPLENKQINTKFDEELRELLLNLSQFDFDFEYIKGTDNTEADCLSRNPVIEANEPSADLKVVNLIEMKDILKDQQKNILNLEKMYQTLTEDKVIFKKFKNSKKIIVSDDLAKEIIEEVHKKMGHTGPKQTEYAIRPYFFNSNFQKLIKNYCHQCSVCIKNKTRTPYQIGLLSQLGPAKKPFEIMSLDTIGGLAGNNSPKRYIHLLVDHFTRYAYCITSKGQSAKDFQNLINLVLKDGHSITTLLADQYAGINSKDFKDFLKEKKINLVLTAVDCPSSNGLNERLNQTLTNRLRCKKNETAENKKRPWTALLSECLNEYNNTVHTVTKFSPNYLLNNVQFSAFPGLSPQIQKNLKEDRDMAYKNSVKSHEANKKNFDKKKRPGKFKIGDLVFVHSGNSLNRKKLDEIRNGPYPIRRIVSTTTYEVDTGKRGSPLYHISKLFPAGDQPP